MIAGGVGFIMNMLNLADFLLQFKVIHFLILIGISLGLKYLYGFFKVDVKDPMNAHPLARNFFYLGMAVLAVSLVMRKYHIPYYNILLYIDIAIQFAALAISFSAKMSSDVELNEDLLDL